MTLHAILQKLTTTHLLMVSVAILSLLAFASKRVKRALVLSPVHVRRGEVYRLLTAGWIHGDLMHLLTNMFVLSLFADRVLAASVARRRRDARVCLTVSVQQEREQRMAGDVASQPGRERRGGESPGREHGVQRGDQRIWAPLSAEQEVLSAPSCGFRG
jgi:hypothetical protein